MEVGANMEERDQQVLRVQLPVQRRATITKTVKSVPSRVLRLVA